MLSTIFEGARIYDGNGSAPYVTDVAVVDDRIAVIGDLSERDALERIPCAGLALAPGFIDVHSHSDVLWLVDPRCEGKIRQGVTTEIGGNCGASPAPLWGKRTTPNTFNGTYDVSAEWATFDDFMRLVERSGVALNVASLVGLGSTRECVAGASEARLDAAELREQIRLVRETIEQGALGVSSGLIYQPGMYADRDELVALARAARDAGGAIYASHVRDEGDRLVAAIEEAIDIGESAEVAVQCSHHKAAWKRNWGRVQKTLELIDAARDRGLAIHTDAYPYIAMWTGLDTLLPDEARAGGAAATLARLRNSKSATLIAMQLELRNADTWHDMQIATVRSERNARLAGMRIDDIARHWGMRPAAAVIRLLSEEELGVDTIFFAMDERDVASVLSAGFTCIGSDASARAVEGPTAQGVPHPRTFGCFPRVFSRYVRRLGVLTVAEAVRRMTSLPADVFGLRDRGRIETGRYADLVVFDEVTITDTATYEQPYAYPYGIRHVVVNGAAVLRNGERTSARSGRVLRGGGVPA